MRSLRTLRADAQGTAVLEFGLSLPLLCMLALAGADFVFGFAHKIALQQYAQAGAEYIVAAGEDVPTDAQIAAEVKAASGLDASKIKVKRFTECNQAKVLSFGLCPGVADVKVNYIEIKVTDTYTPMLSIPGYANFVKTTSLEGKTTTRMAK